MEKNPRISSAEPTISWKIEDNSGSYNKRQRRDLYQPGPKAQVREPLKKSLRLLLGISVGLQPHEKPGKLKGL